MRIPFDELFDESGVNSSNLINEADVILGIDHTSQSQIVLFGRDVLKRFESISRTCNVLEVLIDTDSDQLQRLAAFVKVHKGYHELGNK